MNPIDRLRRSVSYRRLQRAGIVSLEDPLLEWMAFANAGMLHHGHRHLINLAVSQLPSNDPVLEIGAFCGLSTNVITYLLRKHHRPNRLFSTDPWHFEGADQPNLPASDISFSDYRGLVRSEFVRNVQFWSGERLPNAFERTSDDFFEAWHAGGTLVDEFGNDVQLGGPLSFVFIDGDHSYEQALRDFSHADDVLVPGGFILFDDSNQFGPFPQVYEVVLETIHNHGYELIAANPHHLVRKVGGR